MRKTEPLYTIAQVAEILNASEKTVRRLIKKEQLRVIRIGGLLRIDPLDVQDLTRDHRSR
jgi:excisionase family DNA binding protein